MQQLYIRFIRPEFVDENGKSKSIENFTDWYPESEYNELITKIYDIYKSEDENRIRFARRVKLKFDKRYVPVDVKVECKREKRSAYMSLNDVEYYTGEEIPTPASEDFMNLPADVVKEKVVNIVKFIDRNKMSPANISEIFHALHRQENCLGGKIWSIDDIRSQLQNNYEVDLSDKALSVIADYVYGTLDDCNDEEWAAIDEAIRSADISLRVFDIEWDLDPEDFEDEVEMDAVNENELPSEVTIPFSELEGNIEIADYLSDNYDYCVRSYSVEEVLA